MAESGMDERMSLLNLVTGTGADFRESSAMAEARETAPDSEADGEPSWERRHRKGGASARHGSGPSNRRGEKPTAGLRQRAPLVDVGFDGSRLGVGDRVGRDVKFCPWKLIAAYPTMFIGKANKPRAQPFFDSILEGNSWDFFYLHDPRKPAERPHLLVPTAQFENFLSKVNWTLSTALTVPPGANSAKFRLRFGDGGTPEPRYLRQTYSQRGLDDVDWPRVSDEDIGAFKRAPKAHREALVSTLAAMTAASGQRDKKKKAEERARQRALDRHAMMDRAQLHLGLRGEGAGGRVVFVCMDLEALETAPHPVSEVGIAVLDTDDIRSAPPGEDGSAWWPSIKAYHLRTAEYYGMVNHRYVHGCPGAFDFGSSTFPRHNELVSAIKAILYPYIQEQRELLFVAHDAGQDVRYLSSIGFDVLELAGMQGQVDTMAVHQAWRNGNNGRSLRSVLCDLGIPSKNLHNAGNDAVYTMRAMIGLAVKPPPPEESSESDDSVVY
ncbi:hypothetical protein CDD83_5108 [Cordyceps sp. RAO-2017]|nr:hypothetical protein CDD83_5108 [Cordyceps sp. RAO-2017]